MRLHDPHLPAQADSAGLLTPATYTGRAATTSLPTTLPPAATSLHHPVNGSELRSMFSASTPAAISVAPSTTATARRTIIGAPRPWSARHAHLQQARAVRRIVAIRAPSSKPPPRRRPSSSRASNTSISASSTTTLSAGRYTLASGHATEAIDAAAERLQTMTMPRHEPPASSPVCVGEGDHHRIPSTSPSSVPSAVAEASACAACASAGWVMPRPAVARPPASASTNQRIAAGRIPHRTRRPRPPASFSASTATWAAIYDSTADQAQTRAAAGQSLDLERHRRRAARSRLPPAPAPPAPDPPA